MDNAERFNPIYTEGLTQEQVSMRERQGLINSSEEKITKSTGEIFRENIFTLFNAFNFLIAAALALVGAWANMTFLIIIILNVSIGIFQELRAKKLVESLSLISAPKAHVIRRGKQTEILIEKLVLDDILILSAGEQVCSDCVIAEGSVEVNESLLTGESEPLIKNAGDELLSGSFIVSGKCHASVIRVGADNFAAKLAHDAKKHKKINSELLRSMRKITKFTGFFIAPVGILMFIEAYFLRSDLLFDSVVFSAAALLGMLPKGLVLIISISLATGVIKLSKRKILVQQMHCIETLAHVDTLCLDKTGTITEGGISVSGFYGIGGYVPPVPSEKAISCFIAASDDNNSTFRALKERFGEDMSLKAIKKTPFSSERKWSSVTFEEIGTVILGAPEKLITESELPDGIKSAQTAGVRVLCLGFSEEIPDGELPEKINVCAVIEMEDPIRENANETLEFFRNEGVAVKIISGDHPLTVSGIAKRAGFKNHDSYVDLSKLKTDEELAGAALKYDIFGRADPYRKKEIVKALQTEGHIVAMAGDGINDVLALREADCAIAMASGMDAAKQVSHLVLLNSDFAALPDVVMEGRRVINNLTRVASVFFIKTIYSIMMSVFAVVTNSPFPFIPIQITLFDAAIEAYPGFFLSFEPSKKRIEGTFLKNSLGSALPFSILIALNFLVAALFLNFEESADTTLLMYGITGFVSALALIKSCRPFNKLRVFLCVTAISGFFTAIYLSGKISFFGDILHLSAPTTEVLTWFSIFAVISAALLFPLTYAVRRVLKGKRRLN